MFQAHLLLPSLPSWAQSLLQGTRIPRLGEWYLETKIWVLGVLTAARVALLLGPLTW